MYHYVRDLVHSRYPGIKGLQADLFREQLGYLEKYYSIVHPDQVIEAAAGNGKKLPDNAALLTFDDGYIDHYTTVFPILMERGLSGMFFPPSQVVRDHRLLDVNRIHFILAAESNTSCLIDALYENLDEFRKDYELTGNEEYFAEYGVANRWDTAEVIFFKRMLQHALPEELRLEISDRLFAKFVGIEEAAFARELYVNQDQLRLMINSGMHVGSHSASHRWLDKLTIGDQAKEIDESIGFLEEIGAATENWVMCYPYGAYNGSLLDLLRSRQCAIGLTTEVDIADLQHHDPLALPRLDTNDIPKSSTADANDWTLRVLN